MSTTHRPRRRRLPLPLLVCAIALIGAVWAPTVASAAEPTTVPAAEDSYVDSALPTSNFGTRTYLKVDLAPVQSAYLTFDVPAGADIAGGVKLRLYAESGHRTGVSVRTVADTSWSETGVTYDTRPAVGAEVGRSGTLTAGKWVSIDVSSAVMAAGRVSLALVDTGSTTALKLASSEGVNAPNLTIGAPTPGDFTVRPVAGGPYQATSGTTTHTGSLKAVGEAAVADLMDTGGGVLRFEAGTYDLGTEYFKFYDLANIQFVGAGMSATVIKNSSSAAADTEPFNFTGATGVTIRDLSISAGGAARTTSDAIDLDAGNNSTVENVAITMSRGRGIVFDGKDVGRTANGNTVRNCSISNIPGAGIELLASSGNTITGCSITGTGTYGIDVKLSSSSAGQPNKQSSGNTVSSNVIHEAGSHGVHVNSGDGNTITGNRITNSGNRASSRDGIRIASTGGVSCNDNVITGNTATDDQATKTQYYGLHIASSVCTANVVGPGNDFAGNRFGPFKNVGTGTIINQTF